MEQVNVVEHFMELENRIESLIETCKLFEIEIEELKEQNQELTQKLQEKVVVEQQHHELKSVVRQKIDSLMGRLDEISENQQEN
ncbi:MAG: cell division protein ZapB [Desulfobacteraceae bacterium]|nr:cell division protein ZapB [Desulfobacteraceae bacterium]